MKVTLNVINILKEQSFIYYNFHVDEVRGGKNIISILLYSSKLTTCIDNNWLWGINQRAWAQFLPCRMFEWWRSSADRLDSTAFSHIFHLGLIYLLSFLWLLHSLFWGVIIRSNSPAPVLNLRMHPPSPSAPTCPIHFFLPVRATNPLRLRFTLSPYLIPLKPPAAALVTHWTRQPVNRPGLLIIHQPCAPILRPQDTRAYPNWCVREATLCFSPPALSFFLGGVGGGCGEGDTHFSPPCYRDWHRRPRPTRRCTARFALPISLRNFLRNPMNRWWWWWWWRGDRTSTFWWTDKNKNSNNRSLHVGKRRPLCRTRGATADLVSGTRKRGAPLLTVAAQPDWRSVSRSSHAVCVRGDPVDITATRADCSQREREREKRRESGAKQARTRISWK